jgi:hypothetical protein
MAAAIPVIATFAAGATAAGTAAAGFAAVGALATGSLAGFLSVAGAGLSVLGMVTKKDSLKKIGGLMALGGGLTGLAQGAFGGAVDAATGATGAQEAANAAGSAGGAAEVAGGAGASALGDLGMAGTAAADAAGAGSQSLWSTAQSNALAQINSADPLAATGEAVPNSAMPDSQASLYQRAVKSGAGVAPVQAATPLDPLGGGVDNLQQAASTMTKPELDAYRSAAKAKAQAALKAAGGFIKDNKELVSLGGRALASMYGPQAEKLDWEQSIYNRRRNNLNTPIPLANGVR